MSDPDKSSSAGYTYGTSIVLGLFIGAMIMLLYLFTLRPMIQYMLLWVGIPLLSFLLSAGMSLGGQQLACGSIDVASAFLGSVWTPISVWIFLIISSFSIMRAPVISLFSVGETNCRKPRSAVESVCLSDIEQKTPTYQGIARAYYVFWGIMFGQVVSSGFSQVCVGG
jgi:hypothetical protein